MATPAAEPALPASVTFADARASDAALAQSIAATVAGLPAAAPLVVDAAAVQRFDSSALALLLECRRRAVQRGRTFAVRGLPPRLRELARLYGVAGLLPEAA